SGRLTKCQSAGVDQCCLEISPAKQKTNARVSAHCAYQHRRFLERVVRERGVESCPGWVWNFWDSLWPSGSGNLFCFSTAPTRGIERRISRCWIRARWDWKSQSIHSAVRTESWRRNSHCNGGSHNCNQERLRDRNSSRKRRGNIGRHCRLRSGRETNFS